MGGGVRKAKTVIDFSACPHQRVWGGHRAAATEHRTGNVAGAPRSPRCHAKWMSVHNADEDTSGGDPVGRGSPLALPECPSCMKVAERSLLLIRQQNLAASNLEDQPGPPATCDLPCQQDSRRKQASAGGSRGRKRNHEKAGERAEESKRKGRDVRCRFQRAVDSWVATFPRPRLFPLGSTRAALRAVFWSCAVLIPMVLRWRRAQTYRYSFKKIRFYKN